MAALRGATRAVALHRAAAAHASQAAGQRTTRAPPWHVANAALCRFRRQPLRDARSRDGVRRAHRPTPDAPVPGAANAAADEGAATVAAAAPCHPHRIDFSLSRAKRFAS